jgi:transcription elongation GreA/GreB family factor
MNRQITKEVFSFLAMHMKDIQSRKMKLVKQYSMDYDMYVKVLEFLNSYIKDIEVYLDNSVIVEGDSAPPFAVIGSIVSVKDASKREHSYIITAAGTSSTYEASSGCQDVSCFSELGMRLLFKEVGQEVKLGKQSGTSGTISSIKYDFE